MRAYPAADDNDKLPLAESHVDALLYLLSGQCAENGVTFTA